jgi:hypothetical protein
MWADGNLAYGLNGGAPTRVSPEPQLLISADRGSGLVLVRTAYTIAAEKE